MTLYQTSKSDANYKVTQDQNNGIKYDSHSWDKNNPNFENLNMTNRIKYELYGKQNKNHKKFYPHSNLPSPWVNMSQPFIDANSTTYLKKKGYNFIGKTGFIDLEYPPDKPLGSCRPQSCSTHIHFLEKDKLWKHAVALASYPGSGNTWTRWLLQQGTRLWTGSVYCDHRLKSEGFYAECMTQRDIPFKTIATKTHYPAFGRATFARVGFKAPTAAIFILRAPFEAILSFFTLKTARTVGGQDFHTAQLPQSYYSGKAFKSFVKMATKKWVRHLDAINGPHPLGTNGKIIPILLVNYENLVYRFVPEIRRMFYFLREVLELGDRMPQVEEAILCAMRQTEGKEHRSHKEIFNPFNKELVSIVCNMTAKYWNEELYGPCNGQLQSQRNLVKMAIPPVSNEPCPS